MENRVWHKVEDKLGTVLVLAGDTLYHFTFTGKNAKREGADATTALLGGQNPATVAASTSKVVPLSAIQRVEVSHGRDTVKFRTVDAGKPVVLEFTVRSDDDAPTIARAVVERAGMKYPERSEDISVVEALIGPVIMGVIAGVLWAFVYGAATTLDSGQEVDVAQGSSRGRAFKRIVFFIAGLLGTKGTIAVGVVLLLVVVGSSVHRIVKRPQRLVWGPDTA
jgi:hypothetical protein